ncbi:UNVERIFIED_CONTAM: hypothetical protein FKN15_006248 [Acipenser sinensis]
MFYIYSACIIFFLNGISFLKHNVFSASSVQKNGYCCIRKNTITKRTAIHIDVVYIESIAMQGVKVVAFKNEIRILFRRIGRPLKESLFCLCFSVRQAGLLALGWLLGLLGEQHGLDVGQHSALSDGDASQQLVELLVVADGELQVTGDDSGFLVVSGGVASQFQDFGGQVLEYRGQIDRGSSAHTLGVIPFSQQPVHTPDRELQPGSGGARFCLSTGFSAGFASSRHTLCAYLSVLQSQIICLFSSFVCIVMEQRHCIWLLPHSVGFP